MTEHSHSPNRNLWRHGILCGAKAHSLEQGEGSHSGATHATPRQVLGLGAYRREEEHAVVPLSMHAEWSDLAAGSFARFHHASSCALKPLIVVVINVLTFA